MTMTTGSGKADATTGEPRKFMFERSFHPNAVHKVERRPVTLKPDEYDALKQSAYDEGFAAGRQAGTDAQNVEIIRILGQIETAVGRLMQSMDALRTEHNLLMRQAVIAVARKLLPHLAETHGLQEIEAVISNTLSERSMTPRLVIRVPTPHATVLEQKIKDIAVQQAFAGQIIVVADAGLNAADCRIEWTDGGVERNQDKTLGEIENNILPELSQTTA